MIDIKSKKWNTMNYIDYLEIDRALDEGIQYEKKNLLPSEYMDAFLTIARSTIIVAHRRKQLSTQELIDLFGAEGSSFWYNDMIDLIISTLRDFDKKLENKANHPINCNSFLVCRLGGKITVQDGGQWYYVAKVALKSNFKIMIYDISEEIFGPHQTINEDGKGGVNGTEQYLKNMMEIDASIDANLREDTKKQLEFYQQMRICLKVLKDAEFAENGVLEVDEDCPLFVKVTVTPQFVIDEEIRQRNARLGFAIAAAGTISALFPEAALAGVVAWVGNSLTIISSVINLAEGSWGGGDTVNSVDLSAQGGTEAAKVFAKRTGYMSGAANIFGKASSSISKLNVVYTFISTLDLIFQSSSDRYYPGRIEIDFIGIDYSYKCTQKYNRDGSLNGNLESCLMSSRYYDDDMRIYSMHPGLYTNNEEIHKMYEEYEVVEYNDFN